MYRSLTTPQLVVDVLIGLVWVLIGLQLTLATGGAWPGILVVLLLSAALAFRRLSPGLALGIAWVGAIVQVAVGEGPNPYDAAILGVQFAVGAYGGRVVRWLGLASAPVGAAVIAIQAVVQLGGRGEVFVVFAIGVPWTVWNGLTAFVIFGVLLTLAWTLGTLTRSIRDNRAARRAEAAAQREVIVQQERNRIARDLHDVVAHSLAVVIAQSDGARYSADPVQKDAALATIAGTSREALGDVRLLLSRLRHEEAALPQPTLADLDALIEQVRGAGLRVEVERSGTPLPLPPGQQLAVYRIVQEALTNALRHGDTSTPVRVGLGWGARGITVEVRNTLDDRARGQDGHGLPGIRERALLAGGTATAEATQGEWLVRASIPVAA